MMRSENLLLCYLLLTIFTFGCSGGSIPLIPSPEPPAPPPQEDGDLDIPEKQGFTHLLFGKARLEFDEDAGKINLVPLHSSQTHYNLTDPLSDPLCPDCIIVEQLWHDEDAKSIGLKISLRNPTDFTFYDVRGIMHGGPGLRIIDNDGFTNLFTPEPSVYNPFLAYCLEKPDIDFSPFQTSECVYSLTYENLSNLDIEFIVEGSYPGHCEEPAILRVAAINDDELFIYGGYANLNVEAIDRQDDITGITAVSDELWDGARNLKGSDGDIYRVAFSNEKKTAAGVRQIEITADSENPDGLVLKQYIDVDVDLTHPMEESHLGGGHPIEGVNYRRNNQSPYLLPDTLEGSEMFDELFYYSSYYSRHVSDLAIANDERMYLGRYEGGGQNISDGFSGSYRYALFSFYFDDDPGEEYPGGREINLTSDSIYTTSRKWDKSTYAGPGGSHGYENTYSYIHYYDSWLNSAHEISTYWGDSYSNPDYGFPSHKYYGDWDGRIFMSTFPLPEDNVAITYGSPKDQYRKPDNTQLLDKNLEVVHDANYINYYLNTSEIIGFALDTDTDSLYIGTLPGTPAFTSGHLYRTNLDEESIWDSSSLWRHFSSYLPVIDDEGGVVGVYNSFIRRVEADGVTGFRINCGVQTRPAILNDGTIAVICETYLKIFDTELNEIARFPLPSGPESGKEASHAPLVDALDNMALILGPHLCIIDRDGNVIAQRTFEDDIRVIRLGPEHLFVALDYAIYRFSN